jgi:predicted ribosomally synthesized peptide with nif11-like leader
MEVIKPRPLQAVSEEQLKAFQKAVKADAALQEKLKAAGGSDAVVAIAKGAGFPISAEELLRAQAEISEDELEGVAGGGWWDKLDSGGCHMYP